MLGYAMIVDINGFTVMVEQSHALVAQFVGDILSGGVAAVEKAGGDVVGFMGDAFLAIFPENGNVIDACFSIAKDCDRQAEYISTINQSGPGTFPLEKGPSLKIGIEYGSMDISEIYSKKLGKQDLYIGRPINYASRILSDGVGNRCHVGKSAYDKSFQKFDNLSEPIEIKGKHRGEETYTYYVFGMGEIWREGKISKRGESYWG